MGESYSLLIAEYLLWDLHRWSPGASIQIEGRILRPGQTKQAHVRMFVTKYSGDVMLERLVTGRGVSVRDGIDGRSSRTLNINHVLPYLRSALDQDSYQS